MCIYPKHLSSDSKSLMNLLFSDLQFYSECIAYVIIRVGNKSILTNWYRSKLERVIENSYLIKNDANTDF